MNKKVIIIGAGGHGNVIADTVQANNDILVGFLDDNNINAIDKISGYKKYNDCLFVVGIGNAKLREKFSKLKCNWYTAIHPTAVISKSCVIEEGTVVMANAVINANAQIGKHCIINTGAIVEHNDMIDDYAHISVGAKLGGTVRIGKRTWVGIGATVKNNIAICNDCVIGAGAVVVDDIIYPGIYKGIPARR